MKMGSSLLSKNISLLELKEELKLVATVADVVNRGGNSLCCGQTCQLAGM